VTKLTPDPSEPFRVFLDVASLVRGGTVEPNWLDDGTSFWWTGVDNAPSDDDDTTHRFDATTNAVEPFEARVVAPAPEPRFLRKRFMDGLPDVHEVLSPDGRRFAGMDNHNLYVRDVDSDELVRLTANGTEEQRWNVLGATWTADSTRIACFRLDDRDVTKMPIVHWLDTIEVVEWIVYPRVGGRIPQQELWLVDVRSGEAVQIDWRTDEHQFVVFGEWLESGDFFLARMGTDHRKLTVLVADGRTGTCREIVSESSDTFIFEPSITLLRDGFILRSERDGWAHLYRYALDGTLEGRLTKGGFPVRRVVDVDEDEGWVYLTAHAEPRVYDEHLYRVRLDGSDFTRLTEGDGQHDVTVSPSRRVFVDTHSCATRPPRTEVRATDGTLLATIAEADISALLAAGWTEPEEFVVKAADGETDLHGVLYKPRDFDPSRRYPVVESMYAGPQMTWAPRRFVPDSGRFPQALAQIGFVAFVVDGRGTPGRSKAFHDVVYGNFGHSEVPDHVAVLRNLAATRPWMDLDRVGLLGGSWGGYLVLRAGILEPDTYHAIVSMYPNVDFDDHDAGLEMFMGWREERPARYASASCLDKVDRIKAELLLVHGTNDVNVTFSCTMKLVHALAEAMKDYELVVLPEQSHALMGTGQIYTQERVRRFFVDRLRPAGRPT
jgi:dipeptidyl aminopeptidase/acylaminoacyl peptidase